MESSPTQNIIPLNTSKLPSISEVGGKGFSLVKLTSLNLEVPPGIILTVNFFSSWLNAIKSTPLYQTFLNSKTSTDDEYKSMLDQIKSWSLSNLKLSPVDIECITKMLKTQDENYNKSIYAVRSSSPEEDLEGASFAGGYETYLGVTFSNLEQFILKAFISCMDFRIFKYKREKKFDAFDMKIAIVVMRQINSDVSGVAFSVNPINNDYDEAVITSNFGLGETVVGGIVTPDQYIVNKLTNAIVDTKLGKKEKVIKINENSENYGTVEKEETDLSSKSSLSSSFVIEITKKLSYIEKCYGCPMDIEFAVERGKLFLLQARPITTYNEIPKYLLSEPNEKRQLYLDVSYIIQGFVKPMSILGLDALMYLFNEFAYKMVNTENFAGVRDSVAGTVGGKIFINLSNLWTIVSKETTVKFFKVLSTSTVNIISGLKEEEYVNSEVPYKMNISKLGMLWRMPVFRIYFSNWFADSSISNFKYYSEELEKKTLSYINQYKEKKISFREMRVKLYDEASYFFKTYIPPVMYNAIVNYKILFNLLEPIFKENPEVQKTFNLLLKCLPNVTTIMGMELFKVSQLVDKSKYKNVSFEEFYEDFKNKKFSDEFYKKYDKYIELYGFRGEGELDLSNKRGYEKPEDIAKQIFTMVKDEDFNPIDLFERTEKERPIVYEKLRKIAKEHGIESDFVTYSNLTIKYLPFRESPKYLIIRLLSHLRPLILQIANDIFIKNGLIDNEDDIWKLSMANFEKVASNPKIFTKLTVSEMIKNDMKDSNLFSSWSRTPIAFDSRGRFFSQTASKKDKNDNELIGETVSWGVVKGKAKVLHHVNEKEFLPGEILVTRATDPGWTPLIISSGGIVLEVGGMLQHGALVSREFNKPCVVGIENVMSVIKDGDELEVDAVNGIVRILSKNK